MFQFLWMDNKLKEVCVKILEKVIFYNIHDIFVRYSVITNSVYVKIRIQAHHTRAES